MLCRELSWLSYDQSEENVQFEKLQRYGLHIIHSVGQIVLLSPAPPLPLPPTRMLLAQVACCLMSISLLC